MHATSRRDVSHHWMQDAAQVFVCSVSSLVLVHSQSARTDWHVGPL